MPRVVAITTDVALQGKASVTPLLGESFLDGEGELRETATPDRAALPLFEVDVDDSARDSFLPKTLGRQLVGPMAVTYGTQLNPGEVLAGTFYDASLAGATIFGFAVPRRRQHDGPVDAEPFGPPSFTCGVPPGKGSIELDAVYLQADGPSLFRLVTNGIAENTTAELLNPAGETRTINCTDALGRIDKQQVEVHHPPGHGLTRAEVVASILQEIDPVPDYAIIVPNDGPTYKEVTLADSNALGFLTGYLEVVGLAIAADPDGVLIIRDLKPPDFATFDWPLDPGDLALDGDIADESSTEGPTSIRATGSEQITHDGIGQRTEVSTIEIFRQYAPKAVEFQIADTGGTLDPSGHTTGTPTLRLVERIVTATTYELQTVVAVVQTRETYYNREATVGEINTIAGVILFTVGRWVETASGPGRLEWIERFRITERIETTHHYDAAGFLEQTDILEYGYYNRQANLGDINASDGIDYLVGRMVDFNGRGRVSTYEAFQVLQRTIVSYGVSVDNFIESEAESVEGYRIRPAGQVGENTLVYASNAYSYIASEQFDVLETRVVTYSPTSESTHQRTTVETDAEGVTVEIRIEDQGGYLPAAKKRDAELPDPAIYPNGRLASRREQVEFEVTITSSALEACRQKWTRRVSSTHLENDVEAEIYARWLLRESASYAVNFAQPINAAIRPAQTVDLDLRPTGPRESLRVDRVQHREVASGSAVRLLTFIVGRAYPDIGL